MKSLLITILLAAPFTTASAESRIDHRSVANQRLAIEAPRATELPASALSNGEARQLDDPFVRNAASALVELNQAATAQATARANWNAAVAGGHPNPAGIWARRHHAAMEAHQAAMRRYDAAIDQLEAARGIK
ncbi:MAG: hypothetical protein AB7O24_18765 [Kofleriaceae bacterium]